MYVYIDMYRYIYTHRYTYICIFGGSDNKYLGAFSIIFGGVFLTKELGEVIWIVLSVGECCACIYFVESSRRVVVILSITSTIVCVVPLGSFKGFSNMSARLESTIMYSMKFVNLVE